MAPALGRQGVQTYETWKGCLCSRQVRVGDAADQGDTRGCQHQPGRLGGVQLQLTDTLPRSHAGREIPPPLY